VKHGADVVGQDLDLLSDRQRRQRHPTVPLESAVLLGQAMQGPTGEASKEAKPSELRREDGRQRVGAQRLRSGIDDGRSGAAWLTTVAITRAAQSPSWAVPRST